MPSTVTREGVHCQKQEVGCQTNTARAVVFGKVERGGIHRHVNKGGGGVIPSCPLSHRGLVIGAIKSPGPVASTVHETLREGAGGSQLVHLAWEGESSAI